MLDDAPRQPAHSDEQSSARPDQVALLPPTVSTVDQTAVAQPGTAPQVPVSSEARQTEPAVADPASQVGATPSDTSRASTEPWIADAAAPPVGWPETWPAAAPVERTGMPVGTTSPGPAPWQASSAPDTANWGAAPTRSRRSYWQAATAVLAVIAIGGVAVALVSLHARDQASDRADRSGVAARSSTAAPSAAPASPTPEQQAASALAGLLAQSVTDRSAVTQAVSDVSDCGPNLDQDITTFDQAASSRQTLLSQLAVLPDGSALPSTLLQTLTAGWQASQQADQDFAQWATDETDDGCTTNDQSDPAFQAAAGPDGQATADKKAFVNLWTPIAVKYGLPVYQWDQL